MTRFAIHPASGSLIHSDDAKEFDKTRYLSRTPYYLVAALLIKSAFTRPLKVLQLFWLAGKIGWKSDRGLFRNIIYAVEAVILAEWCGAESIEHLHVHFGTNPATIAMLAQILSGTTFSFTAHGSEEFEKAPLLALDAKIEHAAFVVGVSSFGRAQLMRWSMPEYWSKIYCIHCGLDEEFLKQKVVPVPSDATFLCVGRLGEHKAQLLLVEATRRVVEAGINCRVVLAGDGPMRSRIEALIRSLNLENNVTITGWIPSDKVMVELGLARALILPSFSENMPVVIMEAMASGRPVISTYVAGIPELVIPGKTGWLVPSGDVVALSHAMTEAAKASADELRVMGTAGRNRIMDQFDARKEAKELLSLFERVIENNNVVRGKQA